MRACASERRIIDSSWRVVAVMRFSGGADGEEEEDGSEPPTLRSFRYDWTSSCEASSVITGWTRERP